jgi:hypothetical protein
MTAKLVHDRRRHDARDQDQRDAIDETDVGIALDDEADQRLATRRGPHPNREREERHGVLVVVFEVLLRVRVSPADLDDDWSERRDLPDVEVTAH